MFKVKITVVEFKGDPVRYPCHFGHKIGDTIIYDGEKFIGRFCSGVLVPIALPDIWHGMRLAFGVGWTYLVLTEVIVMESGLGYLIQISFRRGPREHIYLVIVVVTLIAWAADLAWDRAGRLLFRYRGTV